MADQDDAAQAPAQVQVPLPVTEGIERAPEIYADGFSGILIGNGSIKLNLFSEVSDPETGRPRRVAAARLAMTLGNLVAMNEAITGFLQDAQKQGVIIRHDPPPAPPQTRQ